MKTKSIYMALVLVVVLGALACAEQAQSDRPRDEAAASGQGGEMEFRELTPEEERVIVHKGTELPFSGEFYKHNEKGTYICKRCSAPLYISSSKFSSGCGWPSFDDEIPGAVERKPDADGSRTEILCTQCGAHLGHVFLGEELTEKNTRHCVNSVSLEFIPAKNEQASAKAIFAGGCFWGMEYHFQKAKGVTSTQVGYIGGQTESPTYKEVCYESTGHAEAIEVVFDPEETNFEELARLFFEIHDPTQVNRQGPDIGKQYRSAIFYLDEEQKRISKSLIELLVKKGYDVATELESAGTFWDAETYHQDYYSNNKQQPYCHAYTKRF